MGFEAPESVTGDLIWKLPSAAGTSGQVLSTNGSKVLAWEDKIADSSVTAAKMAPGVLPTVVELTLDFGAATAVGFAETYTHRYLADSLAVLPVGTPPTDLTAPSDKEWKE